MLAKHREIEPSTPASGTEIINEHVEPSAPVPGSIPFEAKAPIQEDLEALVAELVPILL